MHILTLSGSARPTSSNVQLLKALPACFPTYEVEHIAWLAELPLFTAEQDTAPWPPRVLEWRAVLHACDAVVISTPAYLHNLPAVLKNALEWLASSGELVGKPVLPITFTPYPPRGERAMQSLCWSLQALDAKIVTQLPLYRADIELDKAGQLQDSKGKELLLSAVALLCE